jgi:hypothetical protein
MLRAAKRRAWIFADRRAVGETGAVSRPSAADFAALARSSPWRWQTLRFTACWPGDRWRTQRLRAWLRRPDRLRVETLHGELVQVVEESRVKGAHRTAGGDWQPSMQPWWTDAGAPEPQLRADGLVTARADRFASGVCYDAPMYRDYFWVAMLDPVELADGHSPDADGSLPGTEIDTVTEVDHYERPAWEAIVRPTPAYEPRCTCCALLRSREVDIAEAESGAGYDIVLDEYPHAYRVRLDTATGVCVLTEAIGGTTADTGHELQIEAVDTPMPDNLFRSTASPESPRPGWSPSSS